MQATKRTFGLSFLWNMSNVSHVSVTAVPQFSFSIFCAWSPKTPSEASVFKTRMKKVFLREGNPIIPFTRADFHGSVKNTADTSVVSCFEVKWWFAAIQSSTVQVFILPENNSNKNTSSFWASKFQVYSHWWLYELYLWTQQLLQ